MLVKLFPITTTTQKLFLALQSKKVHTRTRTPHRTLVLTGEVIVGCHGDIKETIRYGITYFSRQPSMTISISSSLLPTTLPPPFSSSVHPIHITYDVHHTIIFVHETGSSITFDVSSNDNSMTIDDEDSDSSFGYEGNMCTLQIPFEDIHPYLHHNKQVLKFIVKRTLVHDSKFEGSS